MARLTKNLSFPFFFFFFLSIFFLLVSTGKSTAKFSQEPNRKPDGRVLFIFGDSVLDAGNNNYINTITNDKADFSPYGQTFFGFPTGRFSDGRLISDFIAEYARLPLIPPFLQPGSNKEHGVNFASGGAGALVETYKGLVISLESQLQNYKKVEKMWRKKLGEEEGKKRISRAVYLISIGNNDYISPFNRNPPSLPYSNSQYVGMVIGNLTTFIQEVHKTGGRKFAIMNTLDLGCLPAVRILRPEKNGSCYEQVSLLAKLHKKALPKLLSQLKEQLKDFKYSLFDINTSLQLRMRHPSKFGFKNGEEACCGTGKYGGVYSCGGKRTVKKFELCKNPNDYVFWDSYHLTEKAYKQFADSFWSGGGGEAHNSLVIGPYNLKTLFQIP